MNARNCPVRPFRYQTSLPIPLSVQHHASHLVDARAIRQVREMWVVVHIRGLCLAVERDVRRTVRTKWRGLVVNSQVLLQLPTTS